MIAPDVAVTNVADGNSRLLSQLAVSAVLVEASHRVPTIARNLRCVHHGDEAVRVAGVADDDNLHVFRGGVLNRLTGLGEDRAVDADQVRTFHAVLTWHAADADDDVAITEAIFHVIAIGFHNTRQRRERAVIQFHLHAVQGGKNWRNFDKVQDHRLIRPKHFTGGNTENQSVPNLASGTGHSNSNRSSHVSRILFWGNS